ncbi:MAG TPA: DUF1461 domain-containing protein [Candidatus Limnocylindria bacterium]
MTPSRANPALLAAFGVALAVAILLTGPMLLFVPPVVSFEQARHDVPSLLGTNQATVDRATGSMLGDLFTGGDFAVSIDRRGPVLDAAERSHMRDVGGVVRTLLAADLVALAAALLLGRRLRNERHRRGRAMVLAASAIGALAVLLGAVFAVAFDAAFTVFHGIFFPQGNWQFGPDSNLLRFFPEPLWFDLALIAGGSIVVGALLVALLGRRDLRAGG